MSNTDHEQTVCPATTCPYLGVTDGSQWTGRQDGACHDDCGWHDDGCLAVNDLVVALVEDADSDVTTLQNDEWPACGHSADCQWQAQLDDGVPCPPRLAVMTNNDDLLGMCNNE